MEKLKQIIEPDNDALRILLGQHGPVGAFRQGVDVGRKFIRIFAAIGFNEFVSVDWQRFVRVHRHKHGSNVCLQ
jgi:hypothetical protein